ncbi:MAG: hypothetical protein FWC02_01660 [Firmicutes bacterium]|nr:hypothetical protein [Bacillota bacterium]
MKMTFKSSIRKIGGKLNINFFANGTDNSVSIVDGSTNAINERLHAKQIFSYGLEFSKRFTKFDNGGIRLNGNYNLIDRASNIGWIGNVPSRQDMSFQNLQFIEIRFLAARRLPSLAVRIDENAVNNGQYVDPKFKLTVMTESEPNGIVVPNSQFLWVNHPQFGRTGQWRLDIPRGALGARLEIVRWNRPNVLPRITYFSGEMHEGFDGSNLQSLEIVEEKTGSVDSLSYGLSSNYCKASFLNRNGKFFERQNFELLRRNRVVSPYIECGVDEIGRPKSYPLGRFLSEEWKLDDTSSFMSCKAYDILYGLQDLIINYGMILTPETQTNVTRLPIRPYKGENNLGVRISDAIRTVFDRINEARRAVGIFEEIECIQKLQATANLLLPYVLIEEKSAWDVLQDIANLCCAYVYVNREGKVVIEEDIWITRNILLPDILLQPSASGSYKKVKVSLPFRDNRPSVGNNNVSVSEQSIRLDGLVEYDYKASLFATSNRQSVPLPVSGMANNILRKYINGIDFVDAEWKGDANLELGSVFNSHSSHRDAVTNQKTSQTYECLSNEIRIDNGFRQVTKGRVVDSLMRGRDVDFDAPSLLNLNEANRTFHFSGTQFFPFVGGQRISNINTGFELEAGKSYVIELRYDTTIVLPINFAIGTGNDLNEFNQIASQQRQPWDNIAQIIFTPTESNLQKSSNLILRFDRGSVVVTSTSIVIRDISLREVTTDGEIEITPSNSFKYNLPVTSRTVVNQVNVEYSVLEADSEPGEIVRVNRRDWVSVGDNRIAATVLLSKVYDEISGIEVSEGWESVQFYRVISATSNSLRVEFNIMPGEELRFDNLERFEVKIN